MKNKYENNFFKSKGFYLALYSCVGILLVMGIIVSVRNIMVGNNSIAEKELLNKPDVLEENLAEVGKSEVSSYMDPYEEKEALRKSIDNLVALNKNNEVAEEEKETVEITLGSPGNNINNASVEEKEEAIINDEPETIEQKAEEVKPAEETVLTFEPFTEEDKMSWPIIGEILMDYSVDHVLYDKTLDMYRTNDSIWIQGEVGTQVKSTADGIVEKVYKSAEQGNIVVVDNGNGWSTTYSQLQDNILVKVGDVVRVGQVIGGVGNPSKYTVLEGSHLEVKIAKENETIDPKKILAQ